jgi:hypothetical protein
MSADIVEIHWNARPHLERLGVNLRRGGIDDRGKKLLDEVRKSLVGAFPGAPVLFRISVHTGASTDDLRVLRQGVEQPGCLHELRTAIEHVVQHAQHEAA